MRNIKKRILSVFLCFLIVAALLPAKQVKAATESSKAGVVNVTNYPLNVRKSASTSASVLTRLPKGSFVTLISQSGEWWRVEYAKGSYGYCHKNYIKVVDSTVASVNTSSGVLYVRSGSSTSYGIIGKLQKGENVVVLSTTNGWSRIIYSGTKTGYASAKYLSGQSQVKYPAISLNVPYYSQTDSRWKNVTLGRSGKTIGDIGCTTTAVAMTESYLQGKTIYPHTMSKQLQYTSGGSLYWPSGYVGVTGGMNFTDIYNQLKAGKPVIVGYKNSYGRQHWVVVTGFVGGNTLTAAGFTINDPGTQSRNTLQLLIDKNPIFHKYVYVK